MTTSSVSTAARVLEADLLVLGGGMAGLSAAAWSVQHGESVVLVEKGVLGGTAAHAGFVWTAPSLETLRSAVPDGNEALAARLIEDFGPAIEWVRSLGVECLPPVEVLRFVVAIRRTSPAISALAS